MLYADLWRGLITILLAQPTFQRSSLKANAHYSVGVFVLCPRCAQLVPVPCPRILQFSGLRPLGEMLVINSLGYRDIEFSLLAPMEY
jgi:hypothetical protein